MSEQVVVKTSELTTQQELESRSELDAVYDITRLILEDYEEFKQDCLENKLMVLDSLVEGYDISKQAWYGSEPVIYVYVDSKKSYVRYTNGCEFWGVSSESIIYRDRYGIATRLSDPNDERLLALWEYLQEHLGFFVDKDRNVLRKCTVYNYS